MGKDNDHYRDGMLAVSAGLTSDDVVNTSEGSNSPPLTTLQLGLQHCDRRVEGCVFSNEKSRNSKKTGVELSGPQTVGRIPSAHFVCHWSNPSENTAQ